MKSINFYLKKSEHNKPCLVYAQIKINGERIVASTKTSVYRYLWDTQTQRVHKPYASADLSMLFLNEYLDIIEHTFSKIFYMITQGYKLSSNKLTVDFVKTEVEKIIHYANPFDKEDFRKKVKEFEVSNNNNSEIGLSNSYIITRLKGQGLLKTDMERYPGIIELKRSQLQFKREIKTIKHDKKTA